MYGATVIVIFGLETNNALCCASDSRYNSDDSSYVKPNVCSNNSHASIGNHISAIVESIYEYIEFGSKEVCLPDESTELTLVMETRMSRSLSGAKGKEMPFGMMRSLSYPPSVRLARTLAKPMNRS